MVRCTIAQVEDAKGVIRRVAGGNQKGSLNIVMTRDRLSACRLIAT
jgi:hypothetical protein